MMLLTKNVSKTKKMKLEDLSPGANARKSFYGKAKTLKDNDTLTLYSYDTPIYSINMLDNTLLIISDYKSSTTTRHKKAFLQEYTNLSDKEIKELLVKEKAGECYALKVGE